MTPSLPRLAGLLHHLPDDRDLRILRPDGTAGALHPAAAEVYASVPELVDLAIRQRDSMEIMRLALRLPALTPWPDVLARARSLAERDPARTLDDEGLGGGDGGGR